MFLFITWKTFFISLFIIGAVYYILLAAFCYRNEMINLLKGGIKHKKVHPIEDEDTVGLESVVGEVNGILEKAGKQTDKSELLMQLKERLVNFAELRQAYQVALTHYIIQYAKTFCGVAFSEQELEEIFPPTDGEK